ncbi:PH domain-containing protein [Desertibacillus haloalkaliphilus]|uniref:PH domain-containing protein n=1 Tax=Desertibacillus haloalkaliphilus TaxID=1328930 RepID=UPI001C25AFE8|nr:PH domain-containing protein [Desertibacillus haloalkaliphilus]MBU8907319.1 PH domain-containing protein [Desertibacillus haloalkaliphilus]
MMNNPMRRMHPAAILITIFMRIREFIVPLVVGVLIGSTGQSFTQIFLFVICLFVLIHSILYWVSYRYVLENGELTVQQGIFIKKKRYIRQERVQSIDVVAGVIQRLFSLVKVRIETAGGANEPEVLLVAITKDEANRMRTELLRKEESMGTEQVLLPDEDQIENSTEWVWQLQKRELLIAALTSGGVGFVLSAVLALFTQIEQLLPDAVLETTAGLIFESSLLVLIIVMIILAVIAWLISMTQVVLKYGGFSVVKKDEKLEITRGLLEQRQLSLHLNRITSIRIVSSLFRQPFGYATVYVESAGGGSREEQLSTILFPLIKKRDIPAVLKEIAPTFSVPLQFQRVPKRALLRYLLRNLLPAGLLVVTITFVMPYGHLSVLTLPIVVLLSYFQYRDAGHGNHQEAVWLRFRRLNQTMVIVPRRKIQAAEHQQSLLQSYRSLSTFKVSILTSMTGKSFSVIDLDQTESERLFKWFSVTKAR